MTRHIDSFWVPTNGGMHGHPDDPDECSQPGILNVYDAAAMAATYGSISIVTFVVGTEFLSREHVEFGGHMVAVMSLMESPASSNCFP